LLETLAERKLFSYPPYKDLAYIWVKSKNKDRIKDVVAKLTNKLEIYNEERKISINFDRDNFSKRA
jgi:primosomal protein N'